MVGGLAVSAAIGTCLSLSGGCIVSPAAPTVMDVHAASVSSDNSRLGMRQAIWTERQGRLELAAYGGHPREHETYVFIINEPYPSFLPRMLHLTQSPDDTDPPLFQVELFILSGQLPAPLGPPGAPGAMERYVGTARLRPHDWFGEKRVSLKNVPLASAQDPARSVLISGELVARHLDPRDFAPLLENWTQRMTE